MTSSSEPPGSSPPHATTDPDAYALVRNVLAEIGADVVALAPAQHDALVAVVSHVPHLTAATLMDLAAGLGQEHAALLQLAAGGFRDMTRIAAGQPNIWPDICDDNAEAIVATLDLLIEALGAMRRRVAEHDHDSLLEILGRAAEARRALSDRAPQPEELVEVRIPVHDRTGSIAEVTVLAARAGHQHRRPRDRPLGRRRPGRPRAGGGPALGAHPRRHPVRPGLPGVVLAHRDHPMTDPVPVPSACRRAAATDGDVQSVRGGRPLTGTVAVPGDKSISHRALLLAALAEGTSIDPRPVRRR